MVVMWWETGCLGADRRVDEIKLGQSFWRLLICSILVIRLLMDVAEPNRMWFPSTRHEVWVGNKSKFSITAVKKNMEVWSAKRLEISKSDNGRAVNGGKKIISPQLGFQITHNRNDILRFFCTLCSKIRTYSGIFIPEPRLEAHILFYVKWRFSSHQSVPSRTAKKRAVVPVKLWAFWLYSVLSDPHSLTIYEDFGLLRENDHMEF